jgi:flagellar motor switch protein FliM
MSEDAIAALVDAAKEGAPRTSDDGPAAAPARRRRMHPVDFTRPTKFSSDQERRISRAMEAVCRTATSRLSAELRVPLELEVISTTQLTWTNAHSLVPEGALSAIVNVEPVGTRLLLSGEQGLVLGAIELLAGSTNPAAARPRRLTDIDWALARHFYDRVLAQMTVIWNDVFELGVSVEGLDAHMETAQLAPVSEPTLSVTLEARLAGTSSTLTMLLPWATIAPVIDRFSGRDEVSDVDSDNAMTVRHAVGGVQVPVRAEVAGVHLPIEAVLALRPGDVLPLNAPVDAGITLYAEAVAVHKARPGRSGGRRAVQITGPAGGPR